MSAGGKGPVRVDFDVSIEGSASGGTLSGVVERLTFQLGSQIDSLGRRAPVGGKRTVKNL
jgi:hypothetical protein